MDDPNFVLWLDLETDGHPIEQSILEVGCILTDRSPAFNEVSRERWVVGYELDHVTIEAGTGETLRRLRIRPDWMPEVVFDMHHANGLWDECERLSWRNAGAVHRADVEMGILGWLTDCGVPDEKIPMAGSGVGHFDSRVLDAAMPLLRSRLTYAPLDIGAVRRFVQLKGLPWPHDVEAEKPHRALDDIAIHLDEARWFMEKVRLPG